MVQIDALCTGCPLRDCNEESLHCRYRLHTRPNWQQRRKAAADAKREAKRANETGRTAYWREWQAQRRIKMLLQA